MNFEDNDSRGLKNVYIKLLNPEKNRKNKRS